MSGEADRCKGEIGFSTLLYRYVFFDWLFADFGKARDVLERHAVWQHNRAMRRYLPAYLRRWAVLATSAFALGGLFEQLLGSGVAACFFTGGAMTITGMAQICVLWLLLGRSGMPRGERTPTGAWSPVGRSRRRSADDRGDKAFVLS